MNNHNNLEIHQKELSKFLNGKKINLNQLKRKEKTTKNVITKDMCRMLLRLGNAKHPEDIAGQEVNIDSLLKTKNAKWLENKTKGFVSKKNEINL